MQERRRSKRTKLQSKLMIKRLDAQGNKEVMIDVNDVSKTGVGFICNEVLSIGNVYESYLTIWTKEVIHAFLRIVRIEMIDGKFHYGAVFIGMPEMDAARIETYQTVMEEQEENGKDE
ncbi:MAG: PilZ domain-containing protein [Lachnospiraceae bacterium]|nr:PilZ domain-containing protein [Lachnospiraceae bacterium]